MNYTVRTIWRDNAPNQYGVYALTQYAGREPFVRYGERALSIHDTHKQASEAATRRASGKEGG